MIGDVCSRFWRWILVKILKLKFGQDPEAEFWSTYDLTEKQLWRALNPWVHCALGNVCHYFGIVKSPHYSLFPKGLPGGRLRREKVDKDGKELPTKKKGGGELPTGGLLASGCTTAYKGIFIIMLGMSHSRDYAVSFNNVQNKLSSSSHLLSSSSSSKLAASLNTKYSWERCARVEKKYIWNSFETATMLITIDVFECK